MKSDAATSHAGQLRKLLLESFSESELELLSTDLGLDYESLSGENKSVRADNLIEEFVRRGRLTELIDAAARERPQVDFAALRAVAAQNPEAFRTAQAVAPSPAPGGSLLNAPPDLALKLGIAVGALAVVLLICGFSGGLVASQFITVTLNPVPTSLQEAATLTAKLLQIVRAPSGTPFRLVTDDGEVSSLADQLSRLPDSPVTNPHVRFLANGQMAANAQIKSLGGLQIAIGLQPSVQNGRLVVRLVSGAVNVINVPGSTFGWVVLPNAMLDGVMAWIQRIVDVMNGVARFDQIQISEDRCVVTGVRR